MNARGLHVIAVSEEIDTVYKAMKRGFSDFSDLCVRLSIMLSMARTTPLNPLGVVL